MASGLLLVEAREMRVIVCTLIEPIQQEVLGMDSLWLQIVMYKSINVSE